MSDTKRILRALEMLPTDEGRAIETAHCGHRSYHEAAVALGESEHTVKLRIRTGLSRLAALDEARSVSPALTVGDGS